MLCATWSSPSNCCAAGISLDFRYINVCQDETGFDVKRRAALGPPCRGVGWGTPPVQTEGGVQSAAMHFDERHDGTMGITAGYDSKDREQQDMLQLAELTLGPARVGDIAEQAEQLIERSHGNFLAVWLPCIDSKNSPRRNPPPGTAGTICAPCSGEDSTYQLSRIER
jgi:hypothetical protein